MAVPTLMHFVRGAPPAFGGAAIEQYIAGDYEGRLVQSIKRHLPAATFQRTWLAGHSVTIEELVASFLGWLKFHADQAAGRGADAFGGGYVAWTLASVAQDYGALPSARA